MKSLSSQLGHRLHVDLFREQRVFVHEPVHAFPDYESEVP
jgi:hypothetical protein